MAALFDFPDRVTLQPDGSYRWSCKIDKEYERRAYKLTIKICMWIAVFILGYGAILSRMYDQSMLIILLCAAIFMLIVFGVVFIFDRMPGERKELYILMEEYIHTGTGKTGASFSFNRTKKLFVNAGRGYLELQGRFGGPRIYVPIEDFGFVQSFVMSRMPGDVEIKYI